MRRLLHWFLRALAVPAAAAVACATAPAAGSPAAHVPRGVAVNGLAVGGLSSEEARSKIRVAFSRPLQFRLGKQTWKATTKQLGVAAAVDDAVTAALFATRSSNVRLPLAADPKAVARYVASLDKRFSFPANDARLVGLSDLAPAFEEATPGRKLDRQRTTRAIQRALAQPQRKPIVPSFRPVQPKVTVATYGPVVVIRRESNVLTLYDGPTFVRQFGVATGAPEFPTPLGTFAIVDMQYNPWWRPPASDWAKGLKPVPPGPGNPLGTRWMGLNVYGVGIHGTPDAASIGYSASHGCIRMRIPEAEWLFSQVRYGTPVVIVSA